MPFQYTGFADEAEKTLDGQISTLKECGWSAIELRLLDGKNVVDLTDEEWASARGKLQEEGIAIVGFGGQIGNWARPITNDFQVDIDELKRVAPRMRECGTKYLRIMSYPNPEDNPLSKEDWKAEVVRRIRELATIAEGEGVILAHENCSGYGWNAEGYLEIAEAVDSPALRLVFDTGNNSLHENSTEATWNYYKATRDHIDHVHIKCAKPNPDGTDEHITCHVDEDPVQRRIIEDLENTGYDGWLSIEPHLKAAIHAGQEVDDSGEGRVVWVEFAKRLEKLVGEVTG
ncbi:MAG: sugar phosphate isomerase/epimerase [Verrucomicrobiales bacterium]|nr:sugar phosphate isomerase/epimerase [Verrucomicrobiales bacterium]